MTYTTYRYTLYSVAVLVATAILAGCSGEGPDVIDPNSGERTQTALISYGAGTDGEILRYYEVTGVISNTEYADINGGPVGMGIDAMYEASEIIYLHHRAEGKITAVDGRTREKIAVIDGFAAGDTAALCGMAFSNLSQGWAVAYGAKFLYHLDVKNFLIDEAVPLVGNPTAVAATGTKVYVAMEMPDGTGRVVITHSNNPGLTFEKTINFPTPVIFGAVNPDGVHVAFLTAGSPGVDPVLRDDDTLPRVFIVNVGTDNVDFDQALSSPSLHHYIGQEPNFAGITRNYFLYIATPESLYRFDTQAWGQALDVLFGNYRMVGVDYWSDLLYAVPGNASNRIERITLEGEQLDPVTIPGEIQSILFLRPSISQ